ncbi:MAG TPA: hypothetical protein ENI27_04550 [bacterium]|nr:hypothetical protein [bacterium]
MPDYAGLLGRIGYDAGSLSELFGQHFAEPKASWEEFLQPSFGLAQEALGGLPGQRAGLLGGLSSGLQRRSFVAGRQLAGRAATAGFQGSGQIEQLGEIGRRDIGREYTQGLRGIGETIERREAGILGSLSEKVSGYLQSLVSSGAKLAEPPIEIGVTQVDEETARLADLGLTPEDLADRQADREAASITADDPTNFNQFLDSREFGPTFAVPDFQDWAASRGIDITAPTAREKNWKKYINYLIQNSQPALEERKRD